MHGVGRQLVEEPGRRVVGRLTPAGAHLRAREEQPLLGPGDADVGQPALLLELARVAEGAQAEREERLAAASAPITDGALADGTWTLSAVWDRSILELFVSGGIQTATALAYPEEPLTQFTVNTHAFNTGAVVNVTVYALESVWPGNGTRSIPSSPVNPSA